MLSRHVSDLTGPSPGAFYKLYVQIWYVVIRVLLDTSSRYEVVGRALSVMNTNKLVMYSELSAICSENQHTNALSMKNEEFLTIKNHTR